ncbi:MAG: hypothetical protein IKZ35_02245 [Clostridia bacterium]|nr:hypothetical protein [Clostridia bacterium]
MENEVMHKLGEIESSLKSAHKRIDEMKEVVNSIYSLTEAIHSLKESTDKMNEKMEKLEEKTHQTPPCQHTHDFENMKNSITKNTDDIEEIKSKPGKRWELVITSLLTSIIAAIGGYIAGVFLK